jgi:adenosylmethionine-8-amino-7-oxononanoate aminotransferase
MTTVSSELSHEQLQQAARDHLWLHFTRMSGYRDAEVPIIVRGEGCYLEDTNGKRYLDALAGLFAVQIGYSYGEEVGEAAAAQMRELPFYTNWSYAHPRAIELAAEVASLAPGELNRVFFCSGGSEAVEAAWKLARQYYSARGEHHRAAIAQAPTHDYDAERAARYTGERRWKAISRHVAYHGTTLGALSINGIRSTASRRCARPSSRWCPRCCTSATRTATTARRRRPKRSSRASCSTSSSRRSRPPAPRRSAW